MSSAVVSTPAALGRHFIFDDDPDLSAGTAALDRPVERGSTARRDHLLQATISNQKIPPSSITPASQLGIRPSPEMASIGIPDLDALTGGLPRGCLTEICGPASSGRTTVLLAALAAATRRGEYCALIDASDSLDPHSLAATGVDLDRLLWVRCGEEVPPKSRTKQNATQPGGHPPVASFAARVGVSPQAVFDFDGARLKENPSHQSEHRLEQVLRATDLLLESGGFGLIILDLADLPPQSARRIPLTTWFRFRRAVEHKPTILLAIEQQPIAGSCSSLLLQLKAAKGQKNAALVESSIDAQIPHPTHTQLLTGLDINAELIRSRLDRKPARSIEFATKTAWAG